MPSVKIDKLFNTADVVSVRIPPRYYHYSYWTRQGFGSSVIEINGMSFFDPKEAFDEIIGSGGSPAGWNEITQEQYDYFVDKYNNK